jgi:hypothetical protein
MYEMSRLRELVNNHPDGIIFVGSQRKAHGEIHADVFPLPGRSIQWLQQTGSSEMICLDSLTSVAFCNIVSSLALYSCPPELCFQVMVHLGVARVDRIFACMRSSKMFFHNAWLRGTTIRSLNHSVPSSST